MLCSIIIEIGQREGSILSLYLDLNILYQFYFSTDTVDGSYCCLEYERLESTSEKRVI